VEIDFPACLTQNSQQCFDFAFFENALVQGLIGNNHTQISERLCLQRRQRNCERTGPIACRDKDIDFASVPHRSALPPAFFTPDK